MYISRLPAKWLQPISNVMTSAKRGKDMSTTVTNVENEKNVRPWTDRDKFWADTWRTIILGVIGVFCVTVIFGTLSDEKKFERENKVKALDTFIYKSSAYTAVAADFCRTKDSSVDSRFKSTMVDDYNIAGTALRIYFRDGNLDRKIEEAHLQAKKVFDLCNTHEEPRPSKDLWSTPLDELKKMNLDIAHYSMSRLSRWWSLF